MADNNTDNLVLDLLRKVREVQDNQAAKLTEISQRLGGIETVSGDLLALYATVSNRLDRLDTRVERIETRLGLVDEPQPGE